jgi:hypothetical protein
MDNHASRNGRSGFTAHIRSMLGVRARRPDLARRAVVSRPGAGPFKVGSHLLGDRRGKRRNLASQPHAIRSEARVPTTRADRYAKQLCSHAARMTSQAKWTPPQGVIEFPGDMGTCRITAEPGQLVLVLEATDAVNLTRLQQIIGSNIERFASRDGLKVEWVQPEITDRAGGGQSG